MKKSMITLFFIGAVWVHGMNTCLMITSPKPGDTWFKGETRMISWVSQGNKSAGVKINIFRGSINPANFVQQLTGPATGSAPWNIPSNLKTGPYQLRIKTVDGSCMEDSPVFTILDSIKLIPVQPLDPDPPPSHRAPPLVEPSQASFTIKNIHCDFGEPGKLSKVIVTVAYSSKTAFSFKKYTGHPQDGPVYMNCVITTPKWPADPKWSHLPDPNGKPSAQVVFNHRLSPKYGGKNFLTFIPDILNSGKGEFELVFSPWHTGPVEGIHTMKNMKGSVFDTPDVCEKFYPPKIAIRVFVHTREGIRESFKENYIQHASNHILKLAGELSICSGGIVYW